MTISHFFPNWTYKALKKSTFVLLVLGILPFMTLLTDRLRNIQDENNANICQPGVRENEESLVTINPKPYILMEVSGQPVWSVLDCLYGSLTYSVQ